jgi:hypothetical protein
MLAGSNGVIRDCIFINNRVGHAGKGNPCKMGSIPVCGGGANSKEGGGAVATEQGSLEMTGCLFAENSAGNGGAGSRGGAFPPYGCPGGAGGNGGAVWSFKGALKISNCVFYANEPGDGGPGAPESPDGVDGTAGAVHTFETGGAIANTIVWGNGPNPVVTGMPISFSCIEGGAPGNGNIDVSPQFADPAEGDLRLLAKSPCIDAGDNTIVPVGVVTDLDGEPRFRDVQGVKDTGKGLPPIVDMGPYEYQFVGCLADCNGDGVLSVPDFICFHAFFAAGSFKADCDGNRFLEIGDFICFQTYFALGCD